MSTIYTKQAVFTHVVKHLLTQKAKAHNDKGPSGMDFGCRYLDSQGRRCAVGCLIKPEDIKPWMEGRSVRDLCRASDEHGEVFDALPTLQKHQDLLVELQSIHDMCSPADWFERLTNRARKHGLEMPVLEGT